MSTESSVTTVTRRFSEAEAKQLLGIPAGEKLEYVSASSVERAASRQQRSRGVRIFEMELVVQTKRTE